MSPRSLFLKWFILTFSMTFLFWGCKKEDSNSDLLAWSMLFGNQQSGNNQESLDNQELTPAEKTTVSLQAIDASTGNVIAPAETTIQLKFVGENASLVTDLDGNSITEIGSPSGVFSFQVKAEKVDFLITVKDYITGGQTLYFDDSGSLSATVPLVNVSSPPEGVSAEEKTIGTADADGIISGTIKLSVAAESVAGTSTGVNIPAGTRITDSSGNPLSGDLTAKIAHFNDRSTASLLSLPGGFSVSLKENEDGEEEDTVFLTGGFFALEIRDESGNIAASFSKEMQFTTQMKSGTTHPATGVPVSVGDSIPTWSYNESTGEWSHEGNGEVLSESDGLLHIEYSSNHLSYFNLDWKQDSCTYTYINFTGIPDGIPLTVLIRAQRGSGFARSFNVNDTSLTLRRAPSGLPVIIEAYHDGIVIGSTRTADLCGGTTSVPVSLSSGSTMDLQAQAYCASPTLSDTDVTGFAMYRLSGCSSVVCPPVYAGDLTAGAVTIPFVVPGKTYELSVTTEHPTYGRRSAISTFTGSTGGTIDVNIDYCDALDTPDPDPSPTPNPTPDPSPAPPISGTEDTTSWNKVFNSNNDGGEQGLGIAVDSSGNVYASGASSIYWWLKKFTDTGIEDTTNWDIRPSAGNGGGANAIAIDSSGDVYVTGLTRKVISAQMYRSWLIRKYSPLGVEDTTNWNKVYNSGIPGDDHVPNDILVSGTDVYVVGYGQNLVSTSSADDWLLKKFNLSGVEDTVNWNKTFNGSTEDKANAVAIDSSGNIYVVGTGVAPDGYSAIWVKKFTSSGIEVTSGWDKIIEHPGTSSAEGTSVAIDSSDNIYVGGHSYKLLNESSGSDIWIKKFDSSGVEDTTNWDKRIDNSLSDKLTKLLVDPLTGDVYVIGNGYNLLSASSGYDWWITKFDSSGVEDTANWNKQYDGSLGDDYTQDAALGTDNSIYVIGYGQNLVSGSSNEDMWIKKFTR